MSNHRTRRAARLQKIRRYSIAAIANSVLSFICFLWGSWQFDDQIYDGAALSWSISFVLFICALVCIGIAHEVQDTA